MDNRLEGLDYPVFRFRFTSGLLAEFSVLVDEFHQDRFAELDREFPGLLEGIGLLGHEVTGQQQRKHNNGQRNSAHYQGFPSIVGRF